MSDATAAALPGKIPATAVGRGTAFKIAATAIALGAGVAALLYFSLDTAAAQYMFVDEALAKGAAIRGKRVQVHGYVVKGSIEQKPGTLDYRFRIETHPPRPPGVITAYYTGIVPDTFKSEAEVVATGSLNEAQEIKVVPDGIMAKCPSRYEGKKDDLSNMGTASGKGVASPPAATAPAY